MKKIITIEVDNEASSSIDEPAWLCRTTYDDRFLTDSWGNTKEEAVISALLKLTCSILQNGI